MLVWIEKVSPSEFEVCLQESRVFDGLHEGLKVVSRYSFYVFVLPLILFGLCFVIKPFLIFSIFNNCHTLILYSYLRLATNSLDAPVLVSSFCLFAPVSW